MRVGSSPTLTAWALAPLTAGRGNDDRGAWARKLRRRETLQVGEVSICVVHELKDLEGAEWRVVVSGHSHKPKIEERGGCSM